MRTEQEIALALQTHFPFLAEAVNVPRTQRVVLNMLPQEQFFEVIAYLNDRMGMTRGHNVIGTDEGEDLGFIYMVSGEENIIVTLRTKAPKRSPHIRSLTYMYPSFVLFERELVDLFGAKVEGLPEGPHYPLPDNWPKDQWPLRKEWNPDRFNRDTMQYESTEAQGEAESEPVQAEDVVTAVCVNEDIDDGRTLLALNGGNRVTIPIGPQHPSLDEPASFDITLEGETVKGAVIGIGYNHRGLEKACESRTYVQDLYIIERVCGICSHAHTNAYCMAIEQLAKLTVPPRAEYIRLIVAEL
ncbi:MAG TPA: NADH-quinone oxidoreductase subunit C, partial [Clostridia bacterium]|nr:NADH-quinone oxidoreductase subunit C [Clostridia bacterium]